MEYGHPIQWMSVTGYHYTNISPIHPSFSTLFFLSFPTGIGLYCKYVKRAQLRQELSFGMYESSLYSPDLVKI